MIYTCTPADGAASSQACSTQKWPSECLHRAHYLPVGNLQYESNVFGAHNPWHYWSSRFLPLGRKLTIKDKAATEAALEILKTSKRHPLRVQLVRLLYESDAREKARADAREKRRQARAHKKNVAGLQSEIAALQEQLQEKENTIASLQAEREKDLHFGPSSNPKNKPSRI